MCRCEISFRSAPTVNSSCWESTTPGKVEEEYGHILKAALLHHDFFRTIAARGREVEDAFLYTVGALARASAANDVETGNHLLRVNEYSALLATTMGLVRGAGARAAPLRPDARRGQDPGQPGHPAEEGHSCPATNGKR